MQQVDDLKVNETARMTSAAVAAVQLAVLLLFYVAVYFYSRPLFHGLVAVFTVAISGAAFVTSWSARKFIDNNYLTFIGVALAAVSVFNVLDFFSSQSVQIMPGSSLEMAAQFRLAASLVAGLSFLLATAFVKRKVNHKLLFFGFLLFSSCLSVFIFSFHDSQSLYGGRYPVAVFGVYVELIVVLVYEAAIYFLHRSRHDLGARLVGLVTTAIALLIVSELFYFPLFRNNGFVFFISQLLKVAAYYFLYLGLIETGLMKPYRVLFHHLKDHELAMVEGEERYRTLVENSPNVIYLHVKGKVVYINEAGVKLFRASSKEELLGKNVMDLIAPNYREFVADRISKLLRGERVATVAEVKILALNGDLVDVSSSGTLVKLKGKPAVQTVMMDITKRKHYERQFAAYTEKIEQYADDLRKFKLAVENASDAIYITNEDFEVVFANRATEKISGYYLADMLGKPTSMWRDLSDEAAAAKQATLPRRQPIMQPMTEEVVNMRKNGQRYTAQLEVSPVFGQDGLIDFYVIIERDVTRQKEISQAKTEFVSLASHQLRTPLSSIALSSELFLRGVYGDLTDKQRDSLREIFEASGRMKDLIGDLLSISRIELGTFVIKLEMLDLREHLSLLVREHELMMQTKGISLQTDFHEQLPAMKLDRNILEIVIDNLLSNAIRYTPQGGMITVGYKRRGDDVVVWVKDTGCGIPQDQQGRVFDKLFRADNAQAISAEGSGLGLYMAKSVLKQIGGGIWVESVLGEGSTFFVRLPMHGRPTLASED